LGPTPLKGGGGGGGGELAGNARQTMDAAQDG